MGTVYLFKYGDSLLISIMPNRSYWPLEISKLSPYFRILGIWGQNEYRGNV